MMDGLMYDTSMHLICGGCSVHPHWQARRPTKSRDLVLDAHKRSACPSRRETSCPPNDSRQGSHYLSAPTENCSNPGWSSKKFTQPCPQAPVTLPSNGLVKVVGTCIIILASQNNAALVHKDWDDRSRVVIPHITQIRLSQAVSSHLSNGCHLAFLVSPVNSFSDHHTSIGGSDETQRAHAEVGERLNRARRSSIKFLSQPAQDATQSHPSTHHSLSFEVESTHVYRTRYKRSFFTYPETIFPKFIRMQFSTIAWIVTALMAGQTLATPAKKAGKSILGLLPPSFDLHVYACADSLCVCSDRRKSMHRLRVQLTTRRCLQSREVQHRYPSE